MQLCMTGLVDVISGSQLQVPVSLLNDFGGQPVCVASTAAWLCIMLLVHAEHKKRCVVSPGKLASA